MGKLTQWAGGTVLHQGQPQTFASALPTLLRLRRQESMLRQVLGCRGQPALHAVPASDVPALDWSHCPLDLADGPHMRAVVQLDRLAQVSPLTGWPRAFTAWSAAGVLELRAARGS